MLGGRPWRDWAGLAARLILGGVLLIAGLLKIGSLEQSVLAVRGYQLFDLTWQRIIGYALPVVEIIGGVALIIGLFTRLAGAAGAALMLAFVAGIASAWARGLSLDCGCFGGGGTVDPGQTQYLQDIARDVGLMACGVWLAIRPRTAFAVDNWLFRPITSLAHDPIDDTAEED